MQHTIKKLNPAEITSDVYIVSPSQIEYISERFGNSVANSLNLRTFAPKIRQLAEQAIRSALDSARTMGEKS